ncbi:MAG TPA: nucleotidyltransferase family protein [Chloroflexia bacterium]|nr:nucleotidyltransferase family protein [Chloroflexia bacterium]
MKSTDIPLATVTRESILDLLARHRADLHAMGVRRIGLFGSYARDDAAPESDIDLLAVLEQPSFDTYMGVRFFLEDLFHRKVDLVLEEDVKPRLLPRILDEVIYAQ